MIDRDIKRFLLNLLRFEIAGEDFRYHQRFPETLEVRSSW